jgi:alpha-N-arabinofuranosidase
VDEWGTWWDVEPGTNPGFLYQQNTLRDALVASHTLDIFHRHADRVVMANIAQTVNVLQAMVLTEGDRLVLTPTYHVFAMNRGHHDAASLPVHLAGPPARRAVGDRTLETLSLTASTKDGQALISLTNLEADDAQTVEVDLRGGEFELGEARILNADRLQDLNTFDQPETVVPQPFDGVTRADRRLRVELPPHSFATIRLQLTTAT